MCTVLWLFWIAHLRWEDYSIVQISLQVVANVATGPDRVSSPAPVSVQLDEGGGGALFLSYVTQARLYCLSKFRSSGHADVMKLSPVPE